MKITIIIMMSMSTTAPPTAAPMMIFKLIELGGAPVDCVAWDDDGDDGVEGGVVAVVKEAKKSIDMVKGCHYVCLLSPIVLLLNTLI